MGHAAGRRRAAAAAAVVDVAPAALLTTAHEPTAILAVEARRLDGDGEPVGPPALARDVPAGSRDLHLVVPWGMTIAGRVRDRSGAPAAGVLVEATAEDRGAGGGGGASHVPWAVGVPGRRGVARSAEDGSFVVPGLAAGRYGPRAASDHGDDEGHGGSVVPRGVAAGAVGVVVRREAPR